ncbi:CPBP family intramembrane metalloprotease [Aureisphaera galaxeae]|uniref:CPBP family intramembrane glutamic endopeptidase n=1 Tax=Aureisphaera galaxeae TaxID=1538023 RepID=UPI00234FE044|nr:CPBP family intramembrane glutamic endopeptidase [Aureisphaera galaxeae]MDC8004877.1 CPBP family intramembrane metalloprotease [Aureisphaera galaxeae]
MYIKLAYNYLHDAWRYVIGFVAIFIVWQLGSIPFIIGVMIKASSDGLDALTVLEDPNAIMGVLDANLTLFLMLLSFVIGLIGLWLWVRYVHRQPMLTLTTTRKKIDWGRFGFGFAMVAAFTIVTTLYDYYAFPEDYVVQFNWVPFIILAIVAILMIPLQTSFEEYLFRGYLMQGIGVMAGNRWVPLIVTSVIFGAMHFFNPEVEKLGNVVMVYYIGTGFLLGIMTLMDEGLELALGFHAGNNLVAAMLVTADWTAFQTDSIFKDISDPSMGWDVLIPVLIIYPIFLGLMAWRYKWKNWGEKLFGKVERPPDDSILEIGTE